MTFVTWQVTWNQNYVRDLEPRTRMKLGGLEFDLSMIRGLVGWNIDWDDIR